VVGILASVVSSASAQSSTSAAELFNAAKAREAALRREWDAAKPAALLLNRTRTLVGAYRDLSRLFPTSSYSDDALWRGAMLSADAFWEFGQAPDRTMALRLFQALTDRFPTSSRLKDVPAQVARLQASTVTTRTPSKPAAAATPAADPGALLKSIRRELLPEVVRVTLELERETPFTVQRLDPQPRIAIELAQTRPADSLTRAPLTFDDDVVRQVRIGRLNARTRVLLDLQDAGRYSSYTLYNPYRIVVDIERAAAKGAKVVAAKITKDTKPAAPLAAPLPSRRLTGAWAAVPREPTATAVIATATTAPALPPAANGRGSYSLSRQLGLGVARIVIDAGHGGHDPGAKVSGLTEADVVLDVAQRLQKLLEKKAGVDVVLTRRTDTYVPLEERTAIANRSGADLFLSIHANASPNAAARGIETYFLNFASNPEAEAIAARENAASGRTMRNLPDIVKAIALNNKIDESRDFATAVQTSLYEQLRKTNRDARSLGVKQAPFMVLIGATMPSILAEISFLTNEREGALLKTDRYRQQIAEALFNGIIRYQQALKRTATVAAQ
jgi:N-acetylmuramoyl-L-alanine amidase